MFRFCMPVPRQIIGEGLRKDLVTYLVRKKLPRKLYGKRLSSVSAMMPKKLAHRIAEGLAMLFSAHFCLAFVFRFLL